MKYLAIALLSCCLLSPVLSGAEGVELLKRKDGDRLILSVSNGSLLPMQVRLTGTLSGYQSDIPIPFLKVIPPHSTPDVALLSPVKGANRFSMQVAMEIWPGDPGRAPDTNVRYLFPWAHGLRHRVEQGYFGSFSHPSIHALDFDLAEGEAIHAARGGLVVTIESNFSRGGLDPDLLTKANHIEVLHDDGSIAHYGHLRRHGSARTIGERVQAGDLLGYCGHTGYGSGVHLHFELTRARAGAKPVSFPSAFVGPKGERILAEEGRWYWSIHPGKPFTPQATAQDLRPADFAAYAAAIPADGKIQLRKERREDRLLLYLQNGTEAPVALKITLELQNLERVGEEKKTVQCAARQEVFLGLFRIVKASESVQIGARFEESR